ncbi:HIV TAT specific factor 1 [Gracilaria domingensis]|nr:HIV TAT specific factor 1 [Gracilaria domingensis]
MFPVQANAPCNSPDEAKSQQRRGDQLQEADKHSLLHALFGQKGRDDGSNARHEHVDGEKDQRRSGANAAGHAAVNLLRNLHGVHGEMASTTKSKRTTRATAINKNGANAPAAGKPKKAMREHVGARMRRSADGPVTVWAVGSPAMSPPPCASQPRSACPPRRPAVSAPASPPQSTPHAARRGAMADGSDAAKQGDALTSPTVASPKPRARPPGEQGEREERARAADGSPRQSAAEQRERKRQARKRARKASRLRNQPNTSVYVTGLPPDVTAQELAAFCAKCGILLPDAQTGLARVKIYRDEHGSAKGDALVTYAMRPSVENAIELLDGAWFREGRYAVSVSEASFEHKKARTDGGGERNGSDAPRVSRHLFVREKMSWDDDEQEQQSAPNASRMVILKNVFDANTADYKVIREDMLEGCGECGEVDKVTVFERNAEGAVAVKFKRIEACLRCIQVMNGRWYDGRQLSAQLYDGHSDYRYKETDAEREQRDSKWQQWLEQSERRETSKS